MSLPAWRLWVVQNGRLRSLFVGREEWPEHEPYEARCIRPGAYHYHHWVGKPAPVDKHVAPGEGCNCGIYACIDLAAMLDQMHSSSDGAGSIAGACKVWGKVIPHQRGYVAQFCRPTGLFAGALGGLDRTWAPDAAIRAVAKRYGLPLLDPEEAMTWTAV